jgi:hypothetical protein
MSKENRVGLAVTFRNLSGMFYLVSGVPNFVSYD